jgi:hypothetical protein
MRAMAAFLVIGSLSIGSCGGGRATPPAPIAAQEQDTAPPLDAAPRADAAGTGEGDVQADCGTWCTSIAVCWEEVNEREYN